MTLRVSLARSAATLSFTIFVTACGRDPSPTAPTSAAAIPKSVGTPAATSSAGVVSNTIIPIPENVVLFDACTGEGVHVSGTIHLVTLLTEDANGGTHAQMHFNVQGVSGVGVVSGTKYRGIHNETHASNSGRPAPSEFTTRIDIKLISEGSSSNLTIRDALVHVTVNADGSVTASIDNLVVGKCQ
jgi:hypothetical protein